MLGIAASAGINEVRHRMEKTTIMQEQQHQQCDRFRGGIDGSGGSTGGGSSSGGGSGVGIGVGVDGRFSPRARWKNTLTYETETEVESGMARTKHDVIALQ